MTDQEAIPVLRQAFSVFTETEKANVRGHLGLGTPILCGELANYYASDDGGL